MEGQIIRAPKRNKFPTFFPLAKKQTLGIQYEPTTARTKVTL